MGCTRQLPPPPAPSSAAAVDTAIAAAREVSELGALSEELADRFGELPEPLQNLIALQSARIKLGRAGARVVRIAGDRISITPLELGDEQLAEVKRAAPQARYEPGRSQLSMSLAADRDERFAAIRALADALLAVSAADVAEDRVAV